ncbi:D-alanine--D-alanine ligase [Ectobacillus polymachus]|uniref:D-alanine--D-alanine ligase n=1 Tax=Ectobacillus polymachus TaxID=1508806 RepID=UPI003A853112
MKIKLGLLYGGKSAEHQVSLQTALAATKALDRNKFDIYPIYITEQGQWRHGNRIEGDVTSVESLKLTESSNEVSPLSLSHELTSAKSTEKGIDIVFPLLHGTNGEDGTVQGLLELLNIPYVGNGVLASAAGMDKVIMKNIFAQAGLPQANYVWFIRHEWEKDRNAAYDKVETTLGYPCFVKPANLGSSVGISKCKNREELEAAFEEAFQFDRKIIIEENIVAREVEIGILGNEEPRCSVVGEIVPKKEFYDYKAKYSDESTALIIPADITEEEYKRISSDAITAFQALDGSGLTRADFFLTKDSKVYINEVNTMPGFTPVSMFPLLWQSTGIEYPQLIEELVRLAIKRHEEKQQIKYTI